MSSRKTTTMLGGGRPEMVCCFLCKDDSDDLRACDFRDCCKVYHSGCLEKKHGFLPSPEEQFTCDWHIRLNCGQSSHFQCMCCPISVCHDCLGEVGFVELGMQQKGFCTSCLNRAILIEKNVDPDPRWVQSDYSNAEISDLLFKDYWEDVQDREHLKLAYLEEARVILNRKLDCNRKNSEKFPYEDRKSGAAQDLVKSLGIHKKEPIEVKERDNASCRTNAIEKSKGNTNILSPLSPGSTQKIANSLNDHQVEPPRADQDILKCLRVIEAKPTEGNTNTLSLPFSHGVTQGAGSSDLQVQQTKEDEVTQGVDSSDLQVQQTKGATKDGVTQGADSSDLQVQQTKAKDGVTQGDGSSDLQVQQIKVGEAHRSGVAPNSAPHSQMLNTQDGSSTKAIDIDKDESKHSRHKNNSGASIEEAINLDSDEEEDLHITVQHSLESNLMSGVHLHMEQPESASVVSSLTPMWNYVDPQGNTRGPFPLSWLFRWSGFFDKDFKVWRTGETAEQAILLTDAFLMYL